jgi:predicted TIM-barrel fold metal-dependent hydrolase
MGKNYQVISADSHLEVSTDRWTHRVPEKYRDRAPRRLRLPSGGDAHVVEGRGIMIEPVRVTGEWRVYPFGGRFGENPGSGSAEQRLHEQDIDGVEAEVLYPGSQGPNFWRGIKDDQAYKAVVRAYNDWLGEEYCSVAPDRLIGLGLIPETGVKDAITEMEHCLRIGLKGTVLNAFPAGRMFPSADDDEFWAAAVDMNVPVSVHVMFQFGGAERYSGPWFQYARKFEQEVYNAGRDIVGRYANYYTQRGARDAIRLVVAGVFDRFSSLKIYFAENQIGWIPHWLEQADSIYERNHKWAVDLLGLKPLARLPSEYIKEHCFWGFQNNPVGVQMRHLIGVDRVMWSSDFPHTETDWPNSRRTIEISFKNVPEHEKHRMLAQNAVEFFHLDAP